MRACHRFGENLSMIVTNFNSKIGVSLTKCGNITLYSFGKSIERKPDVVNIKEKVDYIQLSPYFDENTGMCVK